MLAEIGAHMEEQDSKIFAPQLQEQKQQLQSQSATIKSLVQDRDKAVAARERQQQQVLLGQVAYVFSGIVESFIYGPEGSGSLVPLSLSQIAKRASQGQLTEAQQLQLHEVQQSVSAVMPFAELLEADKYLRTLRFEATHGSKAQVKQTTQQMLQTWAGVHCKSAAVMPVRKYVQVLTKFTTSNKPLAPDRSPEDVFWSLPGCVRSVFGTPHDQFLQDMWVFEAVRQMKVGKWRSTCI